LCFGPGTYQLKNKNKELQLILKNTYVYISNKEEARILFTSRKKFNSSKELIRHLFDKIHKKGILYAAITDGKNGAYCSDGENVYYLKAIKIKPKDPTGAGDSFSAGFISALAHDYSIQEALRWGVINSYFVMQKIGAQNGLLYKKYILKYSEEFKNLKIKKI
jgi:ribokinase